MNAIIVSLLIFIISLGLIFSEKINRTIVAISGAVAMVAAGKFMGFYTQEEVIASVDFNTLGLLLGMMILVALLEPTGFFQYLAVYVGKLSKGDPKILLILLGTVTTVLSMFLDNVTSVVLIVTGYHPYLRNNRCKCHTVFNGGSLIVGYRWCSNFGWRPT